MVAIFVTAVCHCLVQRNCSLFLCECCVVSTCWLNILTLIFLLRTTVYYIKVVICFFCKDLQKKLSISGLCIWPKWKQSCQLIAGWYGQPIPGLMQVVSLTYCQIHSWMTSSRSLYNRNHFQLQWYLTLSSSVSSPTVCNVLRVCE